METNGLDYLAEFFLFYAWSKNHIQEGDGSIFSLHPQIALSNNLLSLAKQESRTTESPTKKTTDIKTEKHPVSLLKQGAY